MRSSSVLSTAVAVALLTVGACHDDATAPPPVPSLTASTLSVADTAVLADGSASTLVTVHVTDAGGSPITGDVGGVAILTSAGTIGRVSQRGNAYSATLTAPAVSTDARITATLGGQLLAATAKVHFVTLGVSLTKSTFTVADSVLTGDGISTTVATIHLKDALGNAVTSGAGPVTVETTLGAVGAASQPASDTYVAALTAPLASGNATIYARVNGVFLTTTPGVRFRDVADTLVVTVSGLPGGSSTAVTVVGPGSFSRTLNATTTFVDIIPGTYTITGANVLTSGAIYGPAPSSQTM